MTQKTDGFLDCADHSASSAVITITEYNGVSVVDPRLNAERLGIDHEDARFFGMIYGEFLEALAENRAELEELRLPGDDLYYPEVEE